ncbi:hypothetical protein WR25_16277 [Diploscapter pachys]|uniref:Alcohol dehydrogenase-like C-terminal domain-containing protein n=1 Tax=Diploscapter pachys TaxID=2018661 RepID=A0A2A2L8K7_9BILA|nr:hypothetical protein WR25_16277 [Diploscapter pachys]
MGLKVLAISNKSKEEHCRNLGADYFQDAYADDIVESIRKMTNGGPHGVINLAPAKKAMEDSVLYVRTRGTLVFVGFPKENMPEMNSFYIVYNCLTIKGSLTGNRQDVDDAIAFVTNGAVKVPVELVRLEDVPTAFEKLHKGEIKGRAVVDMALK